MRQPHSPVDPAPARPTPAAATEPDDAPCCAELFGPPLDEQAAEQAAAAFAALADPVRLRLLHLIGTAAAGEACACDLTGPVGRSQPTVSHHLKVLADAGLVTREKRGRWAWYRVASERVAQLADALRT